MLCTFESVSVLVVSLMLVALVVGSDRDQDVRVFARANLPVLLVALGALVMLTGSLVSGGRRVAAAGAVVVWVTSSVLVGINTVALALLLGYRGPVTHELRRKGRYQRMVLSSVLGVVLFACFTGLAVSAQRCFLRCRP